MKVFVVHELENDGCCEADGGDYYKSTIHGVFSTKKKAEQFIKKDRYLKSYVVQIMETVLDPNGRFSNDNTK